MMEDKEDIDEVSFILVNSCLTIIVKKCLDQGVRVFD
jgi:hypothetical protein